MNLINKPLPYTTGSRVKNQIFLLPSTNFHILKTFQLSQLGAGNNLGFNIAFNIGFAMSFITAMFVMFYIKERVSRAKLLQFVSGVNKIIFWITSYVIDYAQFFLISLIFILTLAAYQKDGYSSTEELARNFLLLVVFGFSVLPYTYLWSFVFDIPSSGLARLVIIFIVSGVFCFLAYFIMNNELLGLQWIAEPLGWIMLVSPHFSLARGMSNLNSIQSTIDLCNKQCSILPMCDEVKIDGLCKLTELNCDNLTTPIEQFLCPLKESCCDKSFYTFGDDGIGLNLAAMLFVGIISLVALFIVEYRWIPNIYDSCKSGLR